MPNSLHDFLISATKKASEDLETALLRLPEDKRGWSPGGKARTALDQVAECAIVGGKTADLITTHIWPVDMDFEQYAREKEALAKDEKATLALLKENTAIAIAAISAVSEADLGISINMPWGTMTLVQVMARPYWNMSYHEGQINYIASILGCLD